MFTLRKYTYIQFVMTIFYYIDGIGVYQICTSYLSTLRSVDYLKKMLKKKKPANDSMILKLFSFLAYDDDNKSVCIPGIKYPGGYL